jgi:hypothetical protein
VSKSFHIPPTPPVVPANVRVVTPDGYVMTYGSVPEAVCALGPWPFRTDRVAHHPIGSPVGGWTPAALFLPRLYQVYDTGVFLPASALLRFVPVPPRRSWGCRTPTGVPVFRRAPVPGTGHRPAGRRMFRRPGTFSLLRASSVRREMAALDEHDISVPPVRARLGHSPTSWDDLMIQAGRCRSWKRHRKHQWR